MRKYLRIAEDECSGKTDTMDYVKCRATKMEKEQGTPADKAFPTAWSIACKYKRDQLSDADEHCQKKPSEYFKAKKANGDSMNIPKRYLAYELEAEHDVMARFEKGKPADPTENMSEEDKKKWEEMKEKHGDKFKSASEMTAEEYESIMAGHTEESFKEFYKNMSEADRKKWDANKKKYGDKFKKAHDKTARLMKRQIKILEKYVASAYDVPYFFDDLPSNVIAQLRRVKDQETLHMDVERWLGDWKMSQRMNSRWANSPYRKLARNRLNPYQIELLEKMVSGLKRRGKFVPWAWDGVPTSIQDRLVQHGDYDRLSSDVERWLEEWNKAELTKERLTRSAKENPMNKTAKMALRTLTANWGLTAIEAEDMLAEEEMAEYLAEMEALAFEEMMADELEAGGNSSFKKYKQQKQPGWFIPNTSNKDRGGAGAGKDGDKNHLYHDYGSAPKGKAYQDWYSKNKLWNKENRPSKEKPRKVCPGMSGNSMDC